MKPLNSTVPLSSTLPHSNARSIASINAALDNGRTRSGLLCACLTGKDNAVHSLCSGRSCVHTSLPFHTDQRLSESSDKDFFPFNAFENIKM